MFIVYLERQVSVEKGRQRKSESEKQKRRKKWLEQVTQFCYVREAGILREKGDEEEENKYSLLLQFLTDILFSI